MNSCWGFINMLFVCVLCMNGGDFKFIIGNSNMLGNYNYEGCCQVVKFIFRLFLLFDN